MLFFGIISLILCLIAAIFFIPVLNDYFRTGLVAKFPTLIVCGFTVIAAIQSFFSGMILSCIVRKNRQDFEMELHRTQAEFNKLMKGKNN
jgi:hypothetical protein